jgi:hypothetical protein
MVAATPSNILWSGVIGGWLICCIAGAGYFPHCIATSGEIMVA